MSTERDIKDILRSEKENSTEFFAGRTLPTVEEIDAVIDQLKPKFQMMDNAIGSQEKGQEIFEKLQSLKR